MSLEKTINEKIQSLEKEEKQEFGSILIKNLYDRKWCIINKIDYTNPDIQKAKEKTYIEIYGGEK